MLEKLKRLLRHLPAGRWQVSRRFPAASMQAIAAAIQRSEATHTGQLRFAVEAGMDWHELLRGMTARERAIEVFSQQRIWDTEHNCGVLIYLLLADRRVEIVADRGIHQQVGAAGWGAICREMETAFRQNRFEQGVITGIERISAGLALHFPANGTQRNELPDQPLIL